MKYRITRSLLTLVNGWGVSRHTNHCCQWYHGTCTGKFDLIAECKYEVQASNNSYSASEIRHRTTCPAHVPLSLCLARSAASCFRRAAISKSEGVGGMHPQPHCGACALLQTDTTPTCTTYLPESLRAVYESVDRQHQQPATSNPHTQGSADHRV
jgi:hypothetical protein